MRIGRTLKVLRLAAGLTQHELGERAGMCREMIAGIEIGRNRDVMLSTMLALARALDVQVSMFLDESPRLPRTHRARSKQGDGALTR